MTTQTRPRPAGPRPQDRAPASRLPGGCERLLDGAVAVLATWTVVYHLCLLLRLAVPWAVGLEVLALAVWAGWSFRGRSRRSDDIVHSPGVAAGSSRLETGLVAVVVAAGAAAALLVAIRASWPVIAGLWLTAAVAGSVVATLRCRRAAVPDPAPADGDAGDSGGRSGVVLALVWAVGLAALSMFTRWSNPDDLYYVNLSQWVADSGTFPLRDTIFSDLVYPMSSWPPVASFDALAGTVARLTGVHAASVVYLVVPPVATFLSVLALWRLLRQWRVRAIGVALSLALVFLVFDGGTGYAAPGNLFLIRIWQGKVILLCLLVPLLLVYALRYVERPTNARAGWLFAGGVAAVGLSTTAMFLVPLLALAGAAPLALRRPARALLGFAAMAAYPLAAGALTLAVGGRSADFFEDRRLFRFDPGWFGPEILRDGPLAAIAVFAVLAGALLVPHAAARVTTGLLVAVTGVTFVPGVTQISFDLVGLGPTLWRVSWVATIAALVGVLGAWLSTYGDRRLLRAGVPLGLTVVLVLTGLPIWSSGNGVSLDSSPQWKRSPESVDMAQRAIDAARPGDLVLAPEQLAITITVMTTRVKTVAPRAYFMDYLRDEPGFRYDERLTLVDFANGESLLSQRADVARALTLLDVDHVCLPNDAEPRIDFVQAQGYRPAATSATDSCFTR